MFVDATASNFYRPIQRLSYTLEYAAFAFRPMPYHLTSIICHAAAAIAAEAGQLLGSQVAQLDVAELKRLLATLGKFPRDERVEVNRLENEADSVHDEALSRLFLEEKDPLTVIKWKEVFDYLEEATDRCEDVADVLEGVVVKQG